MKDAMNGGMSGGMSGDMYGNGGMQGMGISSNPLGGSLMYGGMTGQHIQRNSGSIYPSEPRMHYPPEITSYNEEEIIDAQNYKYGPRAYSLDKNFKNGHSYNDYETLENFSENKHYKRLNCLDVANHVKSCPICSKFYDNDKTMYVVAIIILVIICIILMKKVLENYEK
jgi:hypothetical protein